MLKKLIKRQENQFARWLKVARYFPVNYKFDELGYYEPQLNIVSLRNFSENENFIKKIN